ncbi:hypothetical protein BU16DRAFT_585042 [Lophium mytilinum]|uniref:Uncharacterized protein n=1 Tax=Lophium mytilinum TaxID=390894 RepID=A0A6A6QHG8_9PEZI|nr:hypothetical protein BU16DRAFT_585042 [Lophium mytilinum]
MSTRAVNPATAGLPTAPRGHGRTTADNGPALVLRHSAGLLAHAHARNLASHYHSSSNAARPELRSVVLGVGAPILGRAALSVGGVHVLFTLDRMPGSGYGVQADDNFEVDYFEQREHTLGEQIVQREDDWEYLETRHVDSRMELENFRQQLPQSEEARDGTFHEPEETRQLVEKTRVVDEALRLMGEEVRKHIE